MLPLLGEIEATIKRVNTIKEFREWIYNHLMIEFDTINWKEATMVQVNMKKILREISLDDEFDFPRETEIQPDIGDQFCTKDSF